jgi:polysaccharide export outer membrane protein
MRPAAAGPKTEGGAAAVWAARALARAVLLGWGMLALTSGPAAAQPGPSMTTGPGSASAAVPEYRLGPGDVVRITVYQNPDLTLETRLTEAGLVSYPLLGSVMLGNLSVSAAEQRIAEGLRNGNFVRQPQVTLAVLQVRGHQVSVLGQVNRPGRYPLETGDLRLTDALALAGGVTPGGADVAVLMGTRDGRPFREEIDVPGLFAPNGRDRDRLLRHGDTVFIDRQPLAYIYGEVQRPGPMRLERGMTLMQALATGGGLTARGTERGIRVHRRAADGSTAVLQPGLDERLRDGDVVFVRESLF